MTAQTLLAPATPLSARVWSLALTPQGTDRTACTDAVSAAASVIAGGVTGWDLTEIRRRIAESILRSLR